ncbi:MAG: transposase [candidate division WOR-3 bacterium]
MKNNDSPLPSAIRQSPETGPNGSSPRWIDPWGAKECLVVTNLSRRPQFIYDEIYVPRGKVGNRLTELKLDLKVDRLSCHRVLANQFRLLLHTTAYCFFWLLRRHLKDTELTTAQISILRLKLKEIGARIREIYRHIWVHLAPGYSYHDLLPGYCTSCRPARLNPFALLISTERRG